MWLNSFHYQGSLKSLKPHWDLFDNHALANDTGSKPATGTVLKCSWREKNVQPTDDINPYCLLQKKCFQWKASYYLRMLFLSELLYTYPFYIFCAFFLENYKRTPLCSDAEWKQATKSVRKWNFCLPDSLRSEESIHCKLYYAS